MCHSCRRDVGSEEHREVTGGRAVQERSGLTHEHVSPWTSQVLLFQETAQWVMRKEHT